MQKKKFILWMVFALVVVFAILTGIRAIKEQNSTKDIVKRNNALMEKASESLKEVALYENLKDKLISYPAADAKSLYERISQSGGIVSKERIQSLKEVELEKYSFQADWQGVDTATVDDIVKFAESMDCPYRLAKIEFSTLSQQRGVHANSKFMVSAIFESITSKGVIK